VEFEAKQHRERAKAVAQEAPYHRRCERCGQPAGQQCSSVGADAYARGAPLIRPHRERKGAENVRL